MRLPPYSVPPDRPLDPVTLEVLAAVAASARAHGIRLFVAGAMARDIMLHHVHGFRIQRATRDLDLAVHVDSWEAFDALKQALVESGNFANVQGMLQRLRYKGFYSLDLVPFGGVEQDGEVRWPPDHGSLMNMAGYRETLDHTVDVGLSPHLTLPVAPLEGLAVLKLFAWLDRGIDDRKDALDLALMLRHYSSTAGAALWKGEAMARVDFDAERAGAYLLGNRGRRLVATATVELLTARLAEARVRDRLVTHLASAFEHEERSAEIAERLLSAYELGLSED
jgi:predicted nucleotidyltransferase